MNQNLEVHSKIEPKLDDLDFGEDETVSFSKYGREIPRLPITFQNPSKSSKTLQNEKKVNSLSETKVESAFHLRARTEPRDLANSKKESIFTTNTTIKEVELYIPNKQLKQSKSKTLSVPGPGKRHQGQQKVFEEKIKAQDLIISTLNKKCDFLNMEVLTRDSMLKRLQDAQTQLNLENRGLKDQIERLGDQLQELEKSSMEKKRRLPSFLFGEIEGSISPISDHTHQNCEFFDKETIHILGVEKIQKTEKCDKKIKKQENFEKSQIFGQKIEKEDKNSKFLKTRFGQKERKFERNISLELTHNDLNTLLKNNFEVEVSTSGLISLIAVKGYESFLLSSYGGRTMVVERSKMIYRSITDLKVIDCLYSELENTYYIYCWEDGIYKFDFRRREFVLFKRLRMNQKIHGEILKNSIDQRILVCNKGRGVLVVLDALDSQDSLEIDIGEAEKGSGSSESSCNSEGKSILNFDFFGAFDENVICLTTCGCLELLRLRFRESRFDTISQKRIKLLKNRQEEVQIFTAPRKSGYALVSVRTKFEPQHLSRLLLFAFCNKKSTFELKHSLDLFDEKLGQLNCLEFWGTRKDCGMVFAGLGARNGFAMTFVVNPEEEVVFEVKRLRKRHGLRIPKKFQLWDGELWTIGSQNQLLMINYC